MDKLQMAHDWAMKHGKADSFIDRENTVDLAWEYADAMQAEADKRKEKGVPEAINGKKSIREIDDKTRDWVDEEFKVDWSVAPDWANYWTYDKSSSYWWSDLPSVGQEPQLIWFCNDVCWQCREAPSFSYQGDWRESLRERP